MVIILISACHLSQYFQNKIIRHLWYSGNAWQCGQRWRWNTAAALFLMMFMFSHKNVHISLAFWWQWFQWQLWNTAVVLFLIMGSLSMLMFSLHIRHHSRNIFSHLLSLFTLTFHFSLWLSTLLLHSSLLLLDGWLVATWFRKGSLLWFLEDFVQLPPPQRYFTITLTFFILTFTFDIQYSHPLSLFGLTFSFCSLPFILALWMATWWGRGSLLCF